jgi:hypothetical protein
LEAGEMDLQVILGSFGQSRPQIQNSMTNPDQMTVSGPLFIILLIHWELVKWICRLFLGHLQPLTGRIVAQKSEELTCFCPKSRRPQIQHSMTNSDQMTISGPLFITLLIHWELVKWICRLFLGHLAIGEDDCGSEV